MTSKERRKLAYISKQSSRGKLMSDCDDLLSKIVRKERGGICEVHNRKCPRLGVSHILPKGRHERLRFYRQNLIVCGWWCSHQPSHHSSINPKSGGFDHRAVEYEQAIASKLGVDYKNQLLIAEKTQPRLKTFYLKTLRLAFMQELRRLS